MLTKAANIKVTVIQAEKLVGNPPSQSPVARKTCAFPKQSLSFCWLFQGKIGLLCDCFGCWHITSVARRLTLRH